MIPCRIRIQLWELSGRTVDDAKSAARRGGTQCGATHVKCLDVKLLLDSLARLSRYTHRLRHTSTQSVDVHGPREITGRVRFRAVRFSCSLLRDCGAEVHFEAATNIALHKALKLLRAIYLGWHLCHYVVRCAPGQHHRMVLVTMGDPHVGRSRKVAVACIQVPLHATYISQRLLISKQQESLLNDDVAKAVPNSRHFGTTRLMTMRCAGLEVLAWRTLSSGM